ncbi:hypothetical protein [uncultured Polaribacter sp.]|uniref:hypothetical protein n=1 Tax=uncultured Polaribacter sp. TaxID=174711 RepID=UPI002613A443|nr:hypothetical protein [uncultured Polaribacter sp.]
MKTIKIKSLFTLLLIISLQSFGQDNNDAPTSNIQTFTPSRLINKGQWDIKFFNGLYTQDRRTDAGSTAVDIPRENFFTSTLEVFTGVSENNRISLGAIFEFRSNTFNGADALSVFGFDGRSGLSTIAPAIKWQPIENVGNFSIQTALHIPTFSEETNAEGFLDQSAWALQNRFFYDYTFPSNKWQIFTELNTEYSFGSEESFANNSLLLSPGVFLSYFPTNKSTVLVFSQHLQRLALAEDVFTQNGTSLGFGGKYQLTDVTNIEVLYNKFVRGTNFQGLGATYSVGLRFLF